MKVIVGCEVTQAVCIAFRERGHEAYSCDILPCTGGHPEWHFERDIIDLLYTDPPNAYHWDLGIFFPPCTHLASSGAKHFNQKRIDGRQQQAIDFFMLLVNARIKRKAIENPIGIMSTEYRKPDQIIQPNFFGDPFQKTTCLWLENLPPLFHADKIDLFNNKITHVNRGEIHVTKSGKRIPKWYSNNKKIRSDTFPGIANAMAEQWGSLLN